MATRIATPGAGRSPVGSADSAPGASAIPARVLKELTPSEAQFQARVVTLARSLGYLVFHAHSSRHSEAGFADLAMLRERDGRLILAELKVGAARLRPMQQRWALAAARNPSLEWYLWRWVWPGHVMDDIATILQAISPPPNTP